MLLARRSSKLAFHGGAWVFPGGRIDPDDYAGDARRSAAAAARAPRRARRRRKRASTSTPTRSSTSRTGRRPRSRRSGSRRGSSSVRSRAATRSPTAPRPTALQWFRPDDALAARAAGEIELAPPQYVTLLELRDVRDGRRGAGRRSPRRRRSTTRPRFHFVDGDGAVCVYREDVAYDDLGLLDADGPRHRLYLARRRLGVRPRLTPRSGRRVPRCRPLLVGLGRDAQVRLDRLPALRELRPWRPRRRRRRR